MIFRERTFLWSEQKSSLLKRISVVKGALKEQKERIIEPTLNNEGLSRIYAERRCWVEACEEKISDVERSFSMTLCPRGVEKAKSAIKELDLAIQKLEKAVPVSVQLKNPYEKDLYPKLLFLEEKIKEISAF